MGGPKKKEIEAVRINWHLVDPETAYLEWLQVPKELRGRGVGSAAYKEWEKDLPKQIRYIPLHAADAGPGYSGPFWEGLGFSYRLDFGYWPDPSDDLYESSHAMIKGIRGAKTPDPVALNPEEAR